MSAHVTIDDFCFKSVCILYIILDVIHILTKVYFVSLITSMYTRLCNTTTTTSKLDQKIFLMLLYTFEAISKIMATKENTYNTVFR